MSVVSAKSRLLAATLSCTIGVGLLTASAVGYWYAREDSEHGAAELLEAVGRGERYVEQSIQRLRDDAREAARVATETGTRRSNFLMHALRARHPRKWVLLTDLRGKVLATSREQGPARSILGLDGVREVLGGELPCRLWLFPDSAWLLALAPIHRDGELTGLVALGQPVGEGFAKELALASGAAVWLGLGQETVYSGELSAGLRDDFEAKSSGDASPIVRADSTLDLFTVGDGLATETAFVSGGGRVGFYRESTSLVTIPWWRLALLGLLGVFAGMMNWQRLANSFTRIVGRLVYAFYEASEGRLEADVDFSKEERYFTDLTVAYRRMQYEMRQRIDQLTRAAEHREQAAQAKDKFLASISHELRTPLTSVRAYAELLLQFAQDGRSEEETEFLRIIQGESERLTRLIDDVLDLTRIEARTLSWKVEDFDLRDLIQSILDDQDSKITFKSLKVEYEPGYDSVRYKGDRKRLGQALSHLLDNAIKFSPVRGKVRIALSQKLTSIEIRVEDSGPGVPGEAEKKAIFDKFYQRGEALTDRPEGTGLGLALTREILEAHAGSIFCEDSELGGAAFVVRMAKAGESRRDVDADDEGSSVEAFALWSNV